MSFVSITDACRQLGIDAKTLRRWLAHAQLPLQSHRSDGRKKGLSQQHLQQLAALHHRSLPALASPAPSAACPLSAELLTLPEQLASLQAQLSALQQQVQALTQKLSPPAPPVAPRALVPQANAAKPAPLPVRKPAHVLPRVEYASEGHYVVISPTQGILAFEPDSPGWFAWLSKQSAFRFVGQQGHFTAHYDAARGTRIAWRAHRKIRNHTCNLRLGRSNELTVAVLEQAAAKLQAQLT
jgi:transposase-like protein